MYQIDREYVHTIEIKQSKFIAHLVPYEEYDALLERLKEQHPKARHFVKAFRYLNEYDQIVEGSSDDGEPKGTSGKPSLAVLNGAELINVGVVIVRYFGGTKLGTGGLVRAYGDAVNAVIDEATLLAYVKQDEATCRCSYSDLSQVEYLLDKAGVSVVDKAFDGEGVILTLKSAKESLERFFSECGRLVSKL